MQSSAARKPWRLSNVIGRLSSGLHTLGSPAQRRHDRCSSCRRLPRRLPSSALAMQPGQQPYYNQDPWGAQQYAQAPQQPAQAQGFFVPQQVRAPHPASSFGVSAAAIHHIPSPGRPLQPAAYGAAAAPPAQQHGGYAPGPAAPAAYGGGYPTSPGGGYPTSPGGYAAGGQPSTFVPQQPQASQAQPGGSFGGGESDFLTGMAGNVLRQQGQSYLQRGQAFMQVGTGFADGQAACHCACQFAAVLHRNRLRSNGSSPIELLIWACCPACRSTCSLKWVSCRAVRCTTTSPSHLNMVRNGGQLTAGSCYLGKHMVSLSPPPPLPHSC